jgi:tRNA threonylcarbamoyladenosine biosynthesis protein TsaE
MQITYSLDDIEAAAQQFWQYAKTFPVITFSGDLGAGKTTFIRALCKVLNAQDSVSSPTFALINQYIFREQGREKIIYHDDWYRLRDEEEALNAGMEDMLYAKEDHYCFIEWPEKAAGLLPDDALHVGFEIIDTNIRLLTTH